MFKIKSVSVKDASNTPSIVEFTDGLNIIYGPSNCGKTFILDCIDYAMGSSQFNNDDTAGIVEVCSLIDGVAKSPRISSLPTITPCGLWTTTMAAATITTSTMCSSMADSRPIWAIPRFVGYSVMSED